MQIRGTIKIDMYNCILTVIFTDNHVGKVSNSLHSKHHEKHNALGSPAAIAFSPDEDKSQYYIVISCIFKQVDMWAFVHEVDHIKNFILDHRGVKYNRKDDESGAYLSGHIANSIYKLMKRKGISFT